MLLLTAEACDASVFILLCRYGMIMIDNVWYWVMTDEGGLSCSCHNWAKSGKYIYYINILYKYIYIYIIYRYGFSYYSTWRVWHLTALQCSICVRVCRGVAHRLLGASICCVWLEHVVDIKCYPKCSGCLQLHRKLPDEAGKWSYSPNKMH